MSLIFYLTTVPAIGLFFLGFILGLKKVEIEHSTGS